MSITLSTAHSVVEPSSLAKRSAGFIVVLYALISMAPLFWIFATENPAGFNFLSTQDCFWPFA